MAYTVSRSTSPPEDVYVDTYGQYQLKFKWYRYSTWKPRYKYAFYGITTSVAGSYLMAWFSRRPVYANLVVKIPMSLGVTAACYLYGWYIIEKKMINRDAVIKHYVSLHPEDFAIINTPGRKYKEILLPWEPFRAFEKTVPFLSGIKPFFPKELPEAANPPPEEPKKE